MLKDFRKVLSFYFSATQSLYINIYIYSTEKECESDQTSHTLNLKLNIHSTSHIHSTLFPTQLSTYNCLQYNTLTNDMCSSGTWERVLRFLTSKPSGLGRVERDDPDLGSVGDRSGGGRWHRRQWLVVDDGIGDGDR